MQTKVVSTELTASSNLVEETGRSDAVRLLRKDVLRGVVASRECYVSIVPSGAVMQGTETR
jgi:hypothetical protein